MDGHFLKLYSEGKDIPKHYGEQSEWTLIPQDPNLIIGPLYDRDIHHGTGTIPPTRQNYLVS